jgi:uncharacterized flavoprotein (TIGR03862 family)
MRLVQIPALIKNGAFDEASRHLPFPPIHSMPHSSSRTSSPTVAVIGGGPTGLMAAEQLAANGVHVDLYDAMPSVGRKFLLAGKGGMNLTHGEPFDTFVTRYGKRAPHIAPMLQEFGADALRTWAQELGIGTFVGSSGRVFPTDMKAAPLLRVWLKRLRDSGVQFHMRHRWLGWNDERALRFATPDGEVKVQADATILALGGGSWARLGSDGTWQPLLAECDIDTAPLKPANCGFEVNWSEHFRERFAGQPLKAVTASCIDTDGITHKRQGEFVVTDDGVEGSLIYALSSYLRDRIDADGSATLTLDLAPGKTDGTHRSRSRPSARCTFDGQPFAKQGRHRWRQGGIAARNTGERGLRRDAKTGSGDQITAIDIDSRTPDRRSNQQRRRRPFRSAGSILDGAQCPGRVLRRRNARLGSTDRRLSAHSLLCQRPHGRSRRIALAANTEINPIRPDRDPTALS